MKKKNKYYLVGNAHLDPIWQWCWQEGSMEAKATIRSALDRMNEFPDFKFVCSSASVYRWVEEFAPEMFEEVKQRVKEGRFIPVGGQHVQPDCNSPSGEGFARQALYSQRYFHDKFGVTARVGYCVDSFGHNGMLPQILRKSGMDAYIFMRPGPHENALKSDIFNWRSPDGSEVLTYRILDPYCFNFDAMNVLEDRLAYLDEKTATDLTVLPLFYGVGNHGGGPTIQNLELLAEYQKAHPEKEMIFSTLSDFFDEVREMGLELPVHTDDLQHHAPGCYATVSHVKNGVRRGECNLSAAENYGMLAFALCNKKIDNALFEEAWNNICFLHFHDSMGGCSMKEAHEDSRYMYGMALNTAAVQENNALQTISWTLDTKDRSKGLPVVVFNPHAFPVESLVHLNKKCMVVRDVDGNEMPMQLVHSATQECYWRQDTMFKASVPALGYAVYYIDDFRRDMDVVDNTEGSLVSATPVQGYINANSHEGVVLESDIYRIEFEYHTGYIQSFKDKRTDRELITGRAAVPTVIDEYYHDAWSHDKSFFTDVMARFSDATVSVFEEGPLRATVKVVSRYNDSTLTQYFSLQPGDEKLYVRANVDWHEKCKMLKLAWPMVVENPKAVYEIPFGIIERPADGEEEPGLMWTAVMGDNGGFAVINNDTYSSSVKDNTLYHTVLRSPIYADHGGPRDAESRYTDQGEREFSYIITPVGDSYAPVIRAAKLLNKPLTDVIETWHDGVRPACAFAGINVDADNIMLSALKRSEDGKGTVVRLYEVDGKQTAVTVSGEVLPAPLKAEFTPYSVRTFYLADGTQEWTEVLFSELDM